MFLYTTLLPAVLVYQVLPMYLLSYYAKIFHTFHLKLNEQSVKFISDCWGKMLRNINASYLYHLQI